MAAPPATEGRASGARCAATTEAVLNALGESPGTELSFHEERRLALLTVPLRSSGRIYYAAPDLFARYTETPSTSVLVITPGRIRMIYNQSEQDVPVDAIPGVGGLVRAFVSILRGDLDELRRHYEVRLDSGDDCEQWRLTLRPSSEPLRALLERIVIEGKRQVVLRSEIVEPNGDVTATTYEAVAPRRTYTREERERLFKLPQGE